MKTHWTDSVTTRGWIVIWIIAILIGAGFTHITRDICYVGGTKNLGYGSCQKMIDTVVTK